MRLISRAWENSHPTGFTTFFFNFISRSIRKRFLRKIRRLAQLETRKSFLEIFYISSSRKCRPVPNKTMSLSNRFLPEAPPPPSHSHRPSKTSSLIPFSRLEVYFGFCNRISYLIGASLAVGNGYFFTRMCLLDLSRVPLCEKGIYIHI